MKENSLQKTCLKFALFVFTLFSISGAEAQNQTGQRRSVQINIDGKVLEDLSAEERALVTKLEEILEKDFWTWESFPVDLPSTVFTEGPALVRSSDLFLAPNDSRELGELAGARLNAAQTASVHKTGTFIVPSQKYPGQNHVWEVAWFIQNGSDQIRVNLQNGRDSAKRKIIFAFGDLLIAKKPISLRNGLGRFLQGFARPLANLVGLIEREPKFSDDEVAELLAKSAFQTVQEVFKTTMPGFDYSLYDPEILKKLQPVLQSEEAAFIRQWSQIEDGIVDQLSPEERTIERLQEIYDQRYIQFLRSSIGLQNVGAQIPELLVARYKARRIVEPRLQEMDQRISKAIEDKRAEIVKNHPIRSRSSAWLESRLDSELPQVFVNDWVATHSAISEELSKDASLKQESAIYGATFRFHRDEAQKIFEDLKGQRQAVREYKVSRTIWNSKNWEVVNQGTAEEPKFVAITTRDSVVSTSRPFWRLHLIGARSRAYFTNMLRFLVWDGMQHGFRIPGMGLRALFSKDSFITRQTVNPETGEIVDDESSRMQSLWSLRRYWKTAIDQAMERDMAKARGSIIPEGLYRKWTYLKNRIVKGFFTQLALPLAQGGLTLTLCPVTAAIACATPVMAPTFALGAYGISQLLYDFDDPYLGQGGQRSSRWFRRMASRANAFAPLPRSIIWDIGIAGIGQMVGSLLGSAVIGTTGAVQYVWSYTKAGVNTVWDATMRSVLANQLKVPESDSWLARRIEGPGLASEYLYQIRPELAVVALRAQLELMELQQYELVTKQQILKPRAFFEAVFTPFHLGGGQNMIRGDIEAGIKPAIDALEAELAARRKVVNGVTEADFRRVALTAADLLTVLKTAVPLVAGFYEKYLASRLTESEKAEFWADRRLVVGDFVGLTRVLFSTSFGDKFWIPLEKRDVNFRLEANIPDAAEALRNVLEGRSNLDFDVGDITTIENGSVAESENQERLKLNPSSARLLQSCENPLSKTYVRTQGSVN